MLKVIFSTNKKKKKKETPTLQNVQLMLPPISCWFATCVFAVKRFIPVMDAHGISTFLKLVRITGLHFIAT